MNSVNLEAAVVERTPGAIEKFGEDIVDDVKIARCFYDSTEELVSSYQERSMNNHAECTKQLFG